MINAIRTSRGLVAAVAATVLALGAAFALFGSADAAVSNLGVGSATVAPGAQVTVSVTADATTPGIGSYRVDVEYDASLVDATSCTSVAGQCSIDVIGVNTVRINGATTTGITGTGAALGTITFTAGSEEGVADLTVDSGTLEIADPSAETISVTASGGEITIAVPATAAPTDSPAPATATPTASPAKLPSTGGTVGSDSSSSIAWLLAASGLVVVAGGAWAVARARREN